MGHKVLLRSMGIGTPSSNPIGTTLLGVDLIQKLTLLQMLQLQIQLLNLLETIPGVLN